MTTDEADSIGIDPKFWSDRRVLVTGHTGFKGSWLCLYLKTLGASVSGFSLGQLESPSLFEVAKISQDVDSHFGDIRNLDQLTEIFGRTEPEIVLHLAAQPLVRHSFKDPVNTFSTNVMGTVNVLEAVRASNFVKVFINVTSDKCYENKEWNWAYRETEPLGGYDPYSSSKACSELVTSSYRQSFMNDEFNVRVATARAGNVIGGGDWAQDRLIPDLVRHANTGQTAAIRSPEATRPWQHVLNPLSGYILLAQLLWNSPQLAKAWNFGPRDEDVCTVGKMANRLSELWPAFKWTTTSGQHPHEAGLLKVDSSLARHELKWAPKWDLEVTLRRVVEWYQGYENGKDPKDLTLSQLESFMLATT